MRIAFVAFDFGEYCVRLAGGIANDEDARVVCFLPEEEAQPYLHLMSDLVVLRLFKKPRFRQSLKQIRMVFDLVRQIRAYNPDVIHLQLGHMWFNLLGLPFLRKYPLVVTVHDSLIHVGDSATGKTPQWIYDRAYLQAKERIVHAPQVKKVLLDRLDIPAETVHVIPFVLVGDVDASLGADIAEEPMILFFGRIWPYKGLEYLIRAEPLITTRCSNAKIVIAGTGEDFERYRRMMVNPENFIVYNEYVSDNMRAELFHRSSVVVLPYIEASQSFIISIAYRFGKPVVATTVGGLPEMVDDGRTGILVAPRDTEGLADAIVSLMLDDDKRKAFGKNGMRKVNVECAPEAVGQQTRIVYHKAASNSLRGRERQIEEQSSLTSPG